MRFTPQFLDEIRARLPVSSVVSRKVALKKKGREYAGLSPFKVEKTPSFFVNDQKGFYHCFASGEHGDIFKFVMLTEGLTFPEVVERLAAEAGVEMPKREAYDAPQVKEKADERDRLYQLLEASALFFEERFRAADGVAARRYLEKRGVARETLSQFRLGYAPGSKSALKEHLAKAGFTVEEMVLSGMLIGGDDIPVPYDRFRNRVIFPITDLKGRTIAFGGRALDPDAPAKYLNSPETPLFHKGHNLYIAAAARGAAHDTGRVIAVEGYMDVVALVEAGFAETVAPLGTALTEDQARLLWRMCPEPILCFDGDSAGRKAAFRAIDTVLPHLKPGASVKFAFLPDGLDPDDLIRQSGQSAMESVFSRCRPLADVLFEREWGAGDWSTPERRARLEQQLRALVARIEDGAVRSHYERDIRDRLFAAWRATGVSGPQGGRGGAPARAQSGPYGEKRPPFQARSQDRLPSGSRSGATVNMAQQGLRPIPSSALRNSQIVQVDAGMPPYREALIAKTLFNHPWLIEDHSEEIAALEFASKPLARLTDAILSVQAADNSLDRSGLRSQLTMLSLDKIVDLIERATTHRCDRFAEPDTPRAEVEAGWRHTLELHERQVGLKRSLDAAERAWHEDGSELSLARILEIKQQLARIVQVAGVPTSPVVKLEQ